MFLCRCRSLSLCTLSFSLTRSLFCSLWRFFVVVVVVIFEAMLIILNDVVFHVCARHDVSVFAMPSHSLLSFSSLLYIVISSNAQYFTTEMNETKLHASNIMLTVCVLVVRQVSKHTDTCTMHNVVASEWTYTYDNLFETHKPMHHEVGSLVRFVLV